MDNIKDLQELYETISRAIGTANEKIRAAGGKLSSGDSDYIDRLTHSLKSIKAVMKMEEDTDMDYDRGYERSYDNRSYRRSRSYDDGYSRRNRDSMGRYSRHSGDMVDDLHELMDNATDEQTRQDLQRILQRMEQR